MRLHPVFLLLAIGLVFAACSGGGGKTSSSAADADYINRVIPFVVGCNAGQAVDNQALGHILEQQASDWNSIRPPSSLASLHKAYGTALSKAGTAYLEPSTATAALAEAAAAFDASRKAYNDWYTAFSAKYSAALFTVEGSAMEPTFTNGEVVDMRPLEEPINRWDVVVFRFPLDPSRDFIKRVVALPGETVEVRNDEIYVNGTVVSGDVYGKDTPNYTYAPKTVPSGSYWVLGDNRRNSFDSHAWGDSCAAQPACDFCRAQQQCDFVPKVDILGVLPAAAKGCKSSGGS
jgi:signal peptidase I